MKTERAYIAKFSRTNFWRIEDNLVIWQSNLPVYLIKNTKHRKRKQHIFKNQSGAGEGRGGKRKKKANNVILNSTEGS